MRGFKVRAGLGLTLALVVVGAVLAQEGAGERAALSACREAMADRDFAGAAQRLAAFLDRYRTGERAEEASVLRVRALIGKRDYEGALMAGRTFLSSFPDSSWERKARFLMGEAYARMRGFEDAARIYREQVDFLGGDAHERKVAGYYLSLAAKAYEGEEQPDEFGRKKLVKDFGRALGYYQKARAIRVPEGEEAKISHRIADCQYRLNRFGPALAEWDKLLKEHPESEDAAAATYFSGVCLVRLNRLSDSRTRLRAVRDEYGDSEYAPLSLVALGNTHRPLQTKDEKELARGLDYFKEFRKLYPSHEKAEEVAFSIGDAEYRFGRYDAAIDELRAFLAAFPEGEKSPAAQDQIAWSFFKKHDFDRATAEWKVFLGRWPNHELWTKVQGMIAGAAFAKGRWPLHLADKAAEADRGPYLAEAERGFKSFLAGFPVHAEAGQAQYLIGEILHRRKEYAPAIETWNVAATKYGGTKWGSAALLRVGTTYEKDLGDLPKAIEVYEKLVKRYPASSEARAVAQLLRQFREKLLEVVTERVYRTDEVLELKIRTRNIESLKVRAWRVKPEEVFRRRLTLGGVEGIVVDVVKPDSTQTVATESYEKFRLFTREVPLDLSGPGAWIVTCQEDDLTATTLVVSSDLTIVTKESSDQSLVFAVNEQTGEPFPGVRVLLADPGKVVAEGRTREDGLYLRDGGIGADVRIFAEANGHVAFTGMNVSGGTTFGYSTKAYLYTDRPLYRPGHEVKLKGIYRRVAAGSYTTSAGEKLEVEVRDPRDTVVYSEKLVTNEFGTFDDSLYLPPTAAIGAYRIIAKDAKRRTFTGAFTVREYKKPEFTIDARSERRTYLPGEEVKVEVALRYFFGGPVPNTRVAWRLAVGPYSFDPSVHEEFAWFTMDPARERERKRRESMGMTPWKEGEVTTDADGNAKLTFKAQDRDEDLRYLVVLEALDLNRQWVRDAASVVVTRDGFFALAKTEKKVYRPGEEISVRLTTVDAVHFPVSVKGELVVARRTFEGDRETESIVSRKPAKTGDDGRVSIGVKVDRPGEYRLKFVGKDRRGGLVTGGTVVTIAGEAEDLGRHAKVVASRQIYREGETAEVLVNSPVAPVWALLTFEGERVLDHKVVHLMDRSTTLRLLMKPMYSPNVFVKVAIPKDRKLHEAQDEIYVFKYLDVSVAADRPEAKPGEEVSFTIETADQRGKPVPAEVSLALVDRAILALESDAVPQMKPFFYDQRRTLAVTTGSSYSFRYTGATRKTNKDLLWEDMRKKGAEKFTRAEKYVRAGRLHLARKDHESAVIEFRKALQVLPEHYAARALLDRAQAELLVRRELAELQRYADMEPAEETEEAIAVLESKSVRGFASRGGRGGGGGVRFRDSVTREAQDKNAPMPEPVMSPSDPGSAADAPATADRYIGAAFHLRSTAESAKKILYADFDVEIAQAAQIWDAMPFVPPTLRKRFADTAAWEPRVVTGADGKATVKVTLPDNLTTWRAVARGVTKATLVGEATGEVTARKDVMVRVDTPRFLTQRDTVAVTQTVHNNTGDSLPVRVSFEGTNIGTAGTKPVTVNLKPSEIRVFDHRLSATGSGLATLVATAESQVASDASKSGLPILPHGLMTLVGRSGEVTEEAYESFTLPDGVLPGTKDCWITLSPGIDGSVIESLLYLGGFPWGCLEQTVNRFLPAIAADRALREIGSPDALEKERVRKTVEQGLLALYAFQNKDGSFGWFSGSVRRIGNAGDRRRPAPRTDATMTALAILGIEEARLAGYRVSGKHRAAALTAGKKLVATTADRDEKALLLFALSRGGAATLEDLNQLYRYRDSLSPRALSLLALAMSETGRGYNAVALVRLLEAQAVEKDGTVHFAGGGAVSDAEATAWAIRALYRVTPESPRAGDAVKWLMTNKRGPKWRSTRDTGVAILALADHLVRQGVARSDYVVEVWLNDGEAPYQKIRVAGGKIADDQRRFVKIDGARLRTGANKLKLVKRGPGSLYYSMKLTYFTAADVIPAAGNLVGVARRYAEYVSPVAVKEGEREIVPGWSIVRPEARPKEDTSQTIDRAGTGDKFRIRLTVTARDDLSYVIVTDPLPAGVEVVEGQSTGPFDWEERRDEKQVFFLTHVPKGKKVELSYLVQAIHPGRFHALPTLAYPMYEPEIWGRAAEQVLTILPESGVVGKPSAEEGITPDEIYGLAVRDFREERFDAARNALARLVAEFKLEDKYLEECQAMLMRCAFKAKDSRGAVEAYERLRELNPRRGPRTTVERKALASAYQGIGEHERALSLFKGVTDEYLARELGVAETYRQIGNAYRAQDFVTELLRGYPDSNGAVDQAYRLGRRYLEMRVPEDPKEKRLKPPGVDTGLMLPEALDAFRAFVSHYPESSLADEASRMSVTVLNRMEVPSEAVAEARKFIRRYPESAHTDDVLYYLAESYFEEGKYEEVFETGQRILTGKFRLRSGRRETGPSPFVPHVKYLFAKILHLKDELTQAVGLYRQVKEEFEDAADVLAYLTRKELAVPETAEFGVGETATLTVRHKNVTDLTVRIYPVDLMLLIAVKKDLRKANEIDLTGIATQHRVTRAWPEGEDHRWHEEEVPLGVTEKGVYLVVVKAEDLIETSIVIVSDLSISVQTTDDAVRVYALSRKTGKPVSSVFVKISDGGQIRAQGFTDARGVFEGRKVSGPVMVVAEKEGDSALYRR